MTDLCVDQSYMKLMCLHLVPADGGLTLTCSGLSLDTTGCGLSTRREHSRAPNVSEEHVIEYKKTTTTPKTAVADSESDVQHAELRCMCYFQVSNHRLHLLCIAEVTSTMSDLKF